MTDETKVLLLKSVTDVLERFAFMFAESPEDGREVWNGEYLHSAISFQGPGHGVLSVVAPVPLCNELAGNVLGVMDPDDIDEATAADALKEFLNVVCGELVCELYGSKAVVDLTVPSMCRTDRSRWRELAADGENVELVVEEHPLLVSLLVED